MRVPIFVGRRAARRPPQRVIRKSHLSPARRWLVERMQQLAYGRIEHLAVVNGEPVVVPPPRAYKEHRLTGPNLQGRQPDRADFILKPQVVDLFEACDRIGNGTVAVLEVRDGLPYKFSLEDC